MSLHACILILHLLHLAGFPPFIKTHAHNTEVFFPLKCQLHLKRYLMGKCFWKMRFVPERYSHSQFLMQIVVICDFVGGVDSDTGEGLRGLLFLQLV